jgi:ATP adenylyltransferase/5',5'''-P-1,P-4-tetraphosphate phosphorylase II
MINEIEELFRRQIQTWPRLARGVEGLVHAETRPARIDWFDVFVRHIPHRVTSTTAAVDRDSVAKRPCFLCAGNLDPEEEGIPFKDDFTIYCNPFPIVDRHLTIVYKQHATQQIAHHCGNMLDLAVALPGYFVIYNGPECGASAPDHMHFQAGFRSLFPIEKETASMKGITVPGYGRNLFLIRESDRFAMINRMNRVMELLEELTQKRPEPREPQEPLVNIACFYEAAEWTVYVFPRSKHRPGVFHSGDLTVSPASIDLCGIFVVPLAKDFEKITGDMIASIFQEVTLPDEQVREIAKKLESGW